MSQTDVIYHLGAMLPLIADGEPAGNIQINAMGTFHVLDATRLWDVRYSWSTNMKEPQNWILRLLALARHLHIVG